MCTDDSAEVTGRWARSRAVRGGNCGGGAGERYAGAPASALCTTTQRNRARTKSEKKNERDKDTVGVVYPLLVQGGQERYVRKRGKEDGRMEEGKGRMRK